MRESLFVVFLSFRYISYPLSHSSVSHVDSIHTNTDRRPSGIRHNVQPNQTYASDKHDIVGYNLIQGLLSPAFPIHRMEACVKRRLLPPGGCGFRSLFRGGCLDFSSRGKKEDLPKPHHGLAHVNNRRSMDSSSRHICFQSCGRISRRDRTF